MTDKITVPRETWDAMREALESSAACIQFMTDGPRRADWGNALDVIDAALTAANAASDQDLPVGKCGVLSKSEPQAQGEAERLYDAIEDCLLNHRLHNFMEDDESHYPLVDHISHGDSIEDGRHEIRLICDSIYNTVLKPVHPQATEPASCHQTGVCVRSGLAAENHARLIECAKRLVEHADFALGGILSADSKAKDIPSKAVSQVKSRHLAALRDALPAAPEAKQ